MSSTWTSTTGSMLQIAIDWDHSGIQNRQNLKI